MLGAGVAASVDDGCGSASDPAASSSRSGLDTDLESPRARRCDATPHSSLGKVMSGPLNLMTKTACFTTAPVPALAGDST